MMKTIDSHLKVGDKVSSFFAVATKGRISFPYDYKGHWIALMVNPMDVVRTDEQKAGFVKALVALESKNCQVVCLSSRGMTRDLEWQRSLCSFVHDATQHPIIDKMPVINDSGLAIARQIHIIGIDDSQQPNPLVYYIDPECVLHSVKEYVPNDMMSACSETLAHLQIDHMNGRLSQRRHISLEQPIDNICCWYF